jgi:hypothetical protein
MATKKQSNQEDRAAEKRFLLIAFGVTILMMVVFYFLFRNLF